MNMNKNIREKVVNEIELLSSKKIADDDFEIFSDGCLDSLNVLHIIFFIESEFDIQVNTYDVTIDALSSVNKIVDFICSRVNND